MDPYVYPNSIVLINKLNIQDEQELIDVEAQILIAGIIDIPSIMEKNHLILKQTKQNEFALL